ncbi:hypothetical protein Ancab_005947 [Ancistrocladus abbreviatus]
MKLKTDQKTMSKSQRGLSRSGSFAICHETRTLAAYAQHYAEQMTAHCAIIHSQGASGENNYHRLQFSANAVQR